MDLLDTNTYHGLERGDLSLHDLSNTYGVQKKIAEYKEGQQLRRENERENEKTKFIEELTQNQEIADEDIDMNDPLYTNRIERNKTNLPDFRSSVAQEPVAITRDPRGPIGLRPIIDPITGAKSAGRQIYEKVRLINISSQNRERWFCEPIPVNPLTNQYTRLIEDDEGERLVIKYTAETLNAEYYWNSIECLNNVTSACLEACRPPVCQVISENHNSIAEPFFTRDCTIFMKLPRYPNPNNYTIFFNLPFSYVKEISLVASEIPNPFKTIGLHNNKIIFHIKERKSGRVLPFKSDYRGIPFFVIEIVPGIYSDITQLLREIENLANLSIEELSRANLKFKLSYDSITDIVRIELIDSIANERLKDEWIFHWRFWSHCTIPEERTLYRMLGFAKPFLKEKDGSDYYANIYDNIWKTVGSNDCNVFIKQSRKQAKPFAKPNLFPETFFYLIINNIDLGNDAIYVCNPNITINNIFAKIQIYNQNCDFFPVNTRNLNSSDLRNNILYNTAISTNKVYLENPLRKLDRMDISFVDAFGDLVDFNMQNHSLTFRIVQYIDYLVDSNFDSTRGI